MSYVKIEDLPKSHRGQKEIPKDWIALVQRTPFGQALPITDLKYSTVQGRMKALHENKTIDETYRVTSRKGKVYIMHIKPEKPEKK